MCPEAPHPGPMTRSLPLARPSRAFAFAQWSSRSCQVFPIIEIVAFATSKPFAASQAAQVSFGEEREKAGATFRFKVGVQFKKELGTTERIGN